MRPWTSLDLSNNELNFVCSKILNSPFDHITELNLSNNNLTEFPKILYELKNLEILNLSKNRISSIPVDIFRLRKLRILNIDDNILIAVPVEIGFLCRLEILSLNGNPLIDPFYSLMTSKGKEILDFCRENCSKYKKLEERRFELVSKKSPGNVNLISIGSLNILAPQYATKQRFPYASQYVLQWERRKELIFKDLLSHNFDIFGLQEVETSAFTNSFRNKFSDLGYESLFYPKRSKSNMEIDGCATFWRRDRFKIIEQKCLKFSEAIIEEYKKISENDRMRGKSAFDRLIGKDNICLITILQSLKGPLKNLIVANTHLFWDPDFPDVKLYQSSLILSELKILSEKYFDAGIILMGDFNSAPDSSVHRIFTSGIPPNDEEFLGHDYGAVSRVGTEPLRSKLRDVSNGGITNYTPIFKETIDYIFVSEEFETTHVLEPIDPEYVNTVAGFPTIHVPSDHLIVGCKLRFI